MTQEQFAHWKDFALRMARNAFRKKPKSQYYPDSAWIEAEVTAFFDDLDPLDICVIRSWDHSDDYPKGHEYYHAETFACGTRYAHGPCLGDMMSERGWEGRGDIPLPKKFRDKLARLRWSSADDAYEQEDAIWEEMVDRWFGPVHCCVRAGIDVACPDGHWMGVLGFTAGDLRRMYPEGVPDWVSRGDEKWVTQTMAPCALGLVATAPPRENGTFAEMSDDTEVWL